MEYLTRVNLPKKITSHQLDGFYWVFKITKIKTPEPVGYQ